jgi:diguanylate cyclase (GGDEF)-like protein/PAS domain S-box-containing protein
MRRFQGDMVREAETVIVGRPDVAEPLGDAVICLTVDGTITAFNPAAEQLYGYSAEEVVGQSVAMLAPQMSAERISELMGRVCQGECVRVDESVTRRDGTVLHVAATATPIYGADGEVVGIVSSKRDISKDQAHERRFGTPTRLLEETDTVSMIITRAGGVIEVFNPGAEKMLGYSAEEIVGKETPALFHDWDELDARAAAWGVASHAELFHALAAGEVQEPDWRVRRKDGSWITVALTLRSLYDDQGRRAGHAALLRDVTDVRDAELARERAEERFRIAFQHAPIGLAITGLTGENRGRFLHTNPELARMVGLGPGELDGVPLEAVTYPEDRAYSQQLLTDVGLGTISAEKRYVHRDGTPFWVLVTSTPVPRPDGGPSDYCVAQIVDISERRRFEAQLHYLADHDPLTGLHNRRAFEAELERVVEESRETGSCGALLALDLDGFKVVNDRFGHAIGDELVAQIGGLLRQSVRESDFVSRIGGDEFAIILHDCGTAEAIATAEKVLDAVRTRGTVVTAQATAHVTTSVGIAVYGPGSDTSGAELAVEADIAMYDAKADGRNGHAVYAPDGRSRVELSQRDSWFSRLRRALDDDRFELFAQRIVPISGAGLDRYELLLRLRDDAGELILPGAFIFNAERFDLIGEIDRWVLGQAIRLLNTHHEAGNDLSLSVNLSGHTMNDLSLAGDLADLLKQHPIPPGRLVVEVTETAAIVNMERARELAQELRKLGCLFALDDFGAGFASFYYLKHLEFDYLKIDGEFITKLVSTEVDRLVVRAVVDIARGLGTQTVAEFVGDDETVVLLRELGVDYAQGYHLGMPAPVAGILPSLPSLLPGS